MSDTTARSRAVLRTMAVQGVAAPVVLALGGLAFILGALSLILATLDAYVAPLLVLVACGLLGLLLEVRGDRQVWDWRIGLLAGAALVSALTLRALPLHITGLQVNAIVHRSLVSAVLLLIVAVPTVSAGLYHMLGATPRAEDVSRYPLILAPVLLILGFYGLLLVRMLAEGLPPLNWEALTTPYRQLSWREQIWVDGWPRWVNHSLSEVGMRHHILGTLLLMSLTALIATPIGVAVGVFMSEYGPPWLVRVVRVSTSLLRCMSAFILGLLAYSVVRQAKPMWLSDIVAGFYIAWTGRKLAMDGSFLLAAAIISLLVIPLIGRATEEGCRSLPTELREGSWALGASEAYTLWRVVLPWSLPNITTGVLLACAEAAGDLAIVMFMAGTGDFGVGPLRGVTSLAYLIFGAQYGISKPFRNAMRPYQFTAAALLLVITVGLTVGALALKRRFADRYRGA